MDIADYEALGLQAPAHRRSPPFGPRDVAAILDRTTAATPDAEALVDPFRRLSYRELDDAVNAAMALLAGKGVRPGDRIAASLPNCCDIVVAFLAVQRLGAVWVGINRVLSVPEKRHVLRHAGVSVLITDTAGVEAIDEEAMAASGIAALIVIDCPDRGSGWRDVFAGPPPSLVERADIDPFRPAVIMYTSGTTGIPKGVVHSQHNMVTICAAASTADLLYPSRRRGVVLPLTITNLMILGPLMAFWNGQACVLGQSVKVAAIVEWLHAERIGTMAAVPTMVYDLLQGDFELPAGYTVGSGGAPLPMPIRNAFKERYGYPVGGSYGLTEAPTVVAETRGLEAPAGASGLPLPHLHVSIRDKQGSVVADGEIGEICISAVRSGDWANVYTPALGYWREPEKTQALLHGGVLHTGDMGRIDAEGWLSLADRSSELVLRGGSNIYPGEIENVIHEHTGVAACAVIGQPDPRLGMRTVAFIQPVDAAVDREMLRADLVALCQRTLSRYKLPDVWIFVDAFPRNAMGKIVKPALASMLPAELEQ